MPEIVIQVRAGTLQTRRIACDVQTGLVCQGVIGLSGRKLSGRDRGRGDRCRGEQGRRSVRLFRVHPIDVVDHAGIGRPVRLPDVVEAWILEARCPGDEDLLGRRLDGQWRIEEGLGAPVLLAACPLECCRLCCRGRVGLELSRRERNRQRLVPILHREYDLRGVAGAAVDVCDRYSVGNAAERRRSIVEERCGLSRGRSAATATRGCRARWACGNVVGHQHRNIVQLPAQAGVGGGWESGHRVRKGVAVNVIPRHTHELFGERRQPVPAQTHRIGAQLCSLHCRRGRGFQSGRVRGDGNGN